MSLNYKVIEEPVFDQSNIQIPNKKLLRREDTNAILGVVSKKYKIIQNEDLIKTIPSSFQLTKTHIENNGAKCRAIFQNPNQRFEIDGNTLTPMIMMTNGFDGGTKYLFTGGLFRMVCTNGLVVGIEIVKKTIRRHIGNADPILEVDFSKIDESIDIFKKAAQTPFTLDNAKNFLDEQVKQLKISGKTAINVIQLFEQKMDIKSNSIWGFYNAVTDIASNHSKSINLQNRLNDIALESLELVKIAA